MKRLAYIDALRGWAVLAVIMVHVAPLVPGTGAAVQKVAHDCAYGVQLFFLVSALTLARSWEQRGGEVWPFLVRRLARVAPAFWLAMLVYLVIDGSWRSFWSPQGVSARDVALTATFLNGWRPDLINAIVPGGWSVAVEMMFYLAFPFLIVAAGTLGRAVVLAAGAVLYSVYVNPYLSAAWIEARPDLPRDLVYACVYLWLPNQLCVFLMGISAWRWIEHESDERGRAAAPLLAGMALVCIALLPFVGGASTHVWAGLWFALLAVAMHHGGAQWLAPRWVQRCGEISFSMYIWHYAVIIVLAGIAGQKSFGGGVATLAAIYAGVVAVTWALAAVSWRLVERPGIALGERVIGRWREGVAVRV
jgi:peptidoglycan/LPS O-acetylase OafA/YrhL